MSRERPMLRFSVVSAVALLIAVPSAAPAQQGEGPGPYRIVKSVKVGGEGGFDYINADVDARRLYIARRGNGAHVTVYDLDTFAQVGDIPNTNAHGAVVDAKTNHGFASSKPVVMFD